MSELRRNVVRRARDLLARPGDPPTGYSLYSPANDRRFEHWIWAPPGDGPFPVVVVLHGVNDASGFLWWQKGRAQETAAGLVSSGSVPPFILVMATDGGRGRGSGYVDWADGSSNMESHLIGELLPWIDETFATNGRRHIAGNSMGGYGAFTLALRNTGVFESVSGLSAYFAPRSRLSTDVADRFTEMFGDEARRAAHDPYRLAGHDAYRPLRMAFDCGRDDDLLEENRSFHAHLDRLGVDHSYRELPGGHQWDYWRARIGAHYRFHLGGTDLS